MPDPDRASGVRALRGKYRSDGASVDEFLALKHADLGREMMPDLPKYGSTTNCPKCGHSRKSCPLAPSDALLKSRAWEWAESKAVTREALEATAEADKVLAAFLLRPLREWRPGEKEKAVETLQGQVENIDKAVERKLRVGEYIHRTCKRCGYSWDETPLDVETP